MKRCKDCTYFDRMTPSRNGECTSPVPKWLTKVFTGDDDVLDMDTDADDCEMFEYKD